MNTKAVDLRMYGILIILLLGSLVVPGAGADDTEIYRASYDVSAGGRPKVLIVFDDSGSMETIVTGQRPEYDPDGDYESVHNDNRIYWSTSGQPPSSGSNQWFTKTVNRCAESYEPLDDTGFFQTSGARRWIASSAEQVCDRVCTGIAFGNRCFFGSWILTNCRDETSPGSWESLSTSQHTPPHIECREDVVNANSSNGADVNEGYPLDNVANDEVYGAENPADSNVNWGNTSYSFYSAHYMDYWHDDSLIEDKPRMVIAQDVITNIIEANPGIDFGLLEFNGNWSNTNHHGGRVVHRIVSNMTSAQRNNVIDMVDSMTAAGSTPLCEASYEAYRYLAGEGLVYGDNMDGNRNPKGDYLPRDTGAESPLGTYTSPSTDCAYTYVIIMTDGEPQNDTHANSAIESLTGKTCNSYPTSGQGDTKNCLPELAEYMATTDLDNDTTNGDQFAITYTVGFATDQVLLSDTAQKGKGKYYTANSADELSAAFQGAILSILSTESTFTSPAVAVDTFTRTESRNEVFFAMFKPDDRIDWPGNIKKLSLLIDDGAMMVDKNGAEALNPATGFIKDNASTFWSDMDGPDVLKGGVGGVLAARDPATRTIYSNTGSGGVLQPYGVATMTRDAFGFEVDADLFSFFGVSNQLGLSRELAWGRGFKINPDNSVSDQPRDWILGDILHSQPLVLNYGALNGFTSSEPDLRILVGTNAGFLHMFGDNNGQEDWAFFPKEMGPILRQRRLNPVSIDHVYGIDASPVAYTNDVDNDGTLDVSDGDKVWVYFGLRRGGHTLYALDVSDPDNPSYLWSIDPSVSGFSELGQTWSAPQIARIPGYKDDNGAPKPVLIFGAGYDTNKDDTGIATPDSIGRGLFVVDAETGALVWSITPAQNSATNLQEPELLHSVPADVTILDSNGTGLADRIYFVDTGGNIWRVDMPGNVLPTPAQDTWQIVKLADLSQGNEAGDRRFFNAPDLARTRFNGRRVDVLLIGSGDRTNPNATDVENRFYMIRDERVAPYATSRPSAADCNAMDPITDFRCFLPLVDSDLFDITSNVLVTGSDEEQEVALDALQEASGWRFDLQHSGEKSLAQPLILGGKVYVPTFTPTDVLSDINVCEPQAGTGRMYIINLLNGERQVDNGLDDSADPPPDLPPIIPPTPTIHIDEDGNIRLLLPLGASGNCESGPGIYCPGDRLPPPYGTYWFEEGY